MTRLEKFEAVNACETEDELVALIPKFANAVGDIEGRTDWFDAEKMALAAKCYFNEMAPANSITRQYGLRQQAMYIKHYS